YDHRSVPANELTAPSQHSELCAFDINLYEVDVRRTRNDAVQPVDVHPDLSDFLLWIRILNLAQAASRGTSNDDIKGCFACLVAQRHVKHANAWEYPGEILKIFGNRFKRDVLALRGELDHLPQDVTAVAAHVDAV